MASPDGEALKPGAQVGVSPMLEADLDEVLVIEAAGRKAPWPRQVFVDELAREWARLDVVRERGGDGSSRVVAFVNYWLVKGEVHLLDIATHPDCRRRGYGALLMQRLLDFARDEDCDYLTLEVRRSNQAAIKLYERYGFTAIAMRPRYYVEDGEDAIVMARDFGKPSESSEPADASSESA